MATKTVDNITAVTSAAETVDNTPRVRIFIPPRQEETMEGVKIDQYEHVTLEGETTLIRRGEHVEVPVPVYLQLRNRFPFL
jgi:dUTPase